MLKSSIIRAAGKLKTVRRQGWLDAGVRDAESVADHSFRTAVIVAFWMPDDKIKTARTKRALRTGPDFDALKAVRMALIHDIAEAEVGDLTPRSGVSGKEKARREELAVKRLGDPEVLSLWREFEKGASPEAIVVHEADVLERILQSREYVGAGYPKKKLAHFWQEWFREIPVKATVKYSRKR